MKTAREELIARTFAESFFKRFLAVLKLLDSTKKIELKFKKVKQTYYRNIFRHLELKSKTQYICHLFYARNLEHI